MSDIMPTKTEDIKTCLEKVYNIAKKRQKELTEEELKSYFLKTNILEILGYETIGKDIRMEKAGKEQKRTDIHCIDEYGNVVFVIEFKKPLDKTNLKEHYDQLWEKYILPLKAKYGIITNGLKLLLYERINTNSQQILDINLGELILSQCETLFNRLQKPVYEITKLKPVITYFNSFQDPNSRIHLDTDIAQKHFFDNFKLEGDSAFGKLLQGTISLFDYQYGKSKFLTSAYDFWLKSYARKPEKVPLMWEGIMEKSGLTTSDEDLYKFMFCLETSYALFTKLMLAKACEDYKFPDVNLRDFIERNITDFRGDIPLVSWGKLLVELIRNMRERLVESIFEEDIFYWWTDKFEKTTDWTYKELVELGKEQNVVEFSKYTAKLLFTLYKFDFSKIAGDPLGDLYQKYFDKETRKALGEFYTPKEVVEYIVDAVKYEGESIVGKRLLDPACGSGTFLVEALKRYLKESEPMAKEKGWAHVLKELCNKFHIVGFDIHPFACIMSQIHFTLILIPYYKKAIEEEPGFVLHRLPIFRTDSLIDESKSEAMTLSMFEGGRSISIKITLPVRAGDKFVDAEVIMPFRGEAISEKTGLLNIPEYFAALQALFDTVKEAARAEQETITQERLESNLKVYLQNKDWARLVGFFMPYGRYFLNTIKKLRTEYCDGRLVKSIEDIILAGLLKNYVEYDFVVGNPPYVRVQMLSKEVNEYLRNNYTTVIGKFDLYIPFVERGIHWLNNQGKLGFINPNLFFNRDYGKKLRGLITDCCIIKQIIDFGDSGVFEDATNYPCIIILNKQKPDKNIIKCIVIRAPKENVLADIKTNISTSHYRNEFYSIFDMEQSVLGLKSWKLAPVPILKVIEKMETICENNLDTLKENIYEGFITGANPIYFIDSDNYSKLNLEKDSLKKVPKGRDIRRWKIYWDNRYVIYPHNDEGNPLTEDQFKTKFPHAYEYLKLHINDLKERKYYGETPEEMFGVWFALVHPKPKKIFEQYKIITPNLSTENNFVFDDQDYYLDHDCYGIILKNKQRNHYLYILALLNSRPLEFYLKQISPFASGKWYRYMTGYLNQLPIYIPKTPKEEVLASQITACVEQILIRVKSEQRASRFPDEYIKEYRASGEEFDPQEIVFNANHKELIVDLEKSPDREFVVKIKGVAPITLDSEPKAEYVKAALAGRRVSKGEKITILIPCAESLAKKALVQWQKDAQEAQGIKALEDEINELVYDLYKLGKNDKEVIEDFLAKF